MKQLEDNRTIDMFEITPEKQGRIDAKFVIDNHCLQVPYRRYIGDIVARRKYVKAFQIWVKQYEENQ